MSTFYDSKKLHKPEIVKDNFLVRSNFYPFCLKKPRKTHEIFHEDVIVCRKEKKTFKFILHSIFNLFQH